MAAEYRIIRTEGPEDSSQVKCVSAWLNDRQPGVDGQTDALVTVVARQPGAHNGAAGTDPANDAWFWGIRQTAAVDWPGCDRRPEVYPWDGQSHADKLEQAVVGANAPEPVTTGDILEQTAGDVAQKVGDTVTTGSNIAGTIAAVALVLGVLHFAEGK